MPKALIGFRTRLVCVKWAKQIDLCTGGISVHCVAVLPVEGDVHMQVSMSLFTNFQEHFDNIHLRDCRCMPSFSIGPTEHILPKFWTFHKFVFIFYLIHIIYNFQDPLAYNFHQMLRAFITKNNTLNNNNIENCSF